MEMLEQLKAARRVSVPLVAIASPDPAATVNAVKKFYEDKIPLLSWDFCRGLTSINGPGKAAVQTILGEQDASASVNPTEMLVAVLNKMPKESVLFMLNAQRFIGGENPSVIQGLWNCRDPFKANKRMIILIGPYMDLPPELAQDVVTIDEALPSTEELKGVVDKLMGLAIKAGMPAPVETKGQVSIVDRAVDALRGLPAFPAEQVTAMSLTDKGLDIDSLWKRKRQMIESTPGLSVWRGGETLDQLGGLHNLKTFLKQVLNGKAAPLCVVFCDEIEKTLAGAVGVGDSSGVSQGMLGIMLSYMQDNNASGIVLVGPAGCGKSAIAKAAGAETGIPVIVFDLSGMKDVFVGSSEQRLRNALKIVTSVSSGRALFIATCNQIAILPPELRRRFGLGTFFTDLPDHDERSVIWNIYIKKYELNAKQKRPKDHDWTPAEVKQCCDVSWRLGCSLEEAAKFVVPIAVSARETIERLRKIAHERFISASKPGLYQYVGPGSVDELPVEPSRLIGDAVN